MNNTTLFDKMLIGVSSVCIGAIVISYWFPGVNQAAFDILSKGALGAIGVFVLKKLSADA